MDQNRILKLGQKWPTDEAGNTYWIGADPLNSRVHHADGLVLLGRECRSFAEIEAVARQIRDELDAVIEEARLRLHKAEASPFGGGDGFQTQVVSMRSGR